MNILDVVIDECLRGFCLSFYLSKIVIQMMFASCVKTEDVDFSKTEEKMHLCNEGCSIS